MAEAIERPRTWGQCQSQELGTRGHSCPWASCRYHLLLEVTEAGKGQTIHLRHGPRRHLVATAPESTVSAFAGAAAEEITRMRETCALRVAERVERRGAWLQLASLGALLGLHTKQGAAKAVTHAQAAARAEGLELGVTRSER
jgi:hypothetical protein